VGVGGFAGGVDDDGAGGVLLAHDISCVLAVIYSDRA
jgi:hypothetical protein